MISSPSHLTTTTTVLLVWVLVELESYLDAGDDDAVSISDSSPDGDQKQPAKVKKYVQGKLYTEAANPEAAENLDLAIAQMIHCNGLPFMLSEDPKFAHMNNWRSMSRRGNRSPNGRGLRGICSAKFKRARWTL